MKPYPLPFLSWLMAHGFTVVPDPVHRREPNASGWMLVALPEDYKPRMQEWSDGLVWC